MRPDMRAELESMLADFEAVSARLTQLKSETAAMTGSAQSSDGSVSVTVGDGGALTRLTIDPSVSERPDLKVLAARIIETARRASAQRGEQVLAHICDAMAGRWHDLQPPDAGVDASQPRGGS